MIQTRQKRWLAKRSAAVCNWIVELRPGDVAEVEGYVPEKYMRLIVERIRSYPHLRRFIDNPPAEGEITSA